MKYTRPQGYYEVHDEIKNSRFICHVQQVQNRQQALAFINDIKLEHPTANHHCSSFIAAAPGQEQHWGYSDDGEPRGTAGAPMFQVLKHSGHGNIVAVVTRYFGGIKLGTGGLARAYSGMVSLALQTLPVETVEQRYQLLLRAEFAHIGTLESLIRQHGAGEVLDREWLSDGQQLIFSLPLSLRASFDSALENAPNIQVSEITL